MRTGVVAKRCSCGSFWRNGNQSCRRCGSAMFVSWGFYVDTHPKGATQRRKTVRSGFPTKDAAERELRRMLEAVETGTYVPPSKLTLDRYLPSWLEGKTHLRPSTQGDVRDPHRALHLQPGLRDRHGPAVVADPPGDPPLLRRAGAARADPGRRTNASQGRAQHPPGAAKGHAESEVIVPSSTVGAGDALLAGFLAAGGEGPDALAEGVAWGAAACVLPGQRCQAPAISNDSWSRRICLRRG
jgi:hypothetical protein